MLITWLRPGLSFVVSFPPLGLLRQMGFTLPLLPCLIVRPGIIRSPCVKKSPPNNNGVRRTTLSTKITWRACSEPFHHHLCPLTPCVCPCPSPFLISLLDLFYPQYFQQSFWVVFCLYLAFSTLFLLFFFLDRILKTQLQTFYYLIVLLLLLFVFFLFGWREK